MNTPNDYAKAAAAASRLAEDIRPVPGEDTAYETGRNLAVFHLRSAADLMKRIAEHMPK